MMLIIPKENSKSSVKFKCQYVASFQIICLNLLCYLLVKIIDFFVYFYFKTRTKSILQSNHKNDIKKEATIRTGFFEEVQYYIFFQGYELSK